MSSQQGKPSALNVFLWKHPVWCTAFIACLHLVSIPLAIPVCAARHLWRGVVEGSKGTWELIADLRSVWRPKCPASWRCRDSREQGEACPVCNDKGRVSRYRWCIWNGKMMLRHHGLT